MSNEPIQEQPLEDEGLPVDNQTAEVPESHDEEDVDNALTRETQDGSGVESEDDLPESDFDSYATDDVEVQENEESGEER